MFQRTASSVDARNDFETDAEWAASRPKGYFNGRREKMLAVAGKRAGFMPAVEGAEQMSPEEKVLRSLRFPWLLSTTCLVQYSTAQHSTVQYSTRRFIFFMLSEHACRCHLSCHYLIRLRRPNRTTSGQ